MRDIKKCGLTFPHRLLRACQEVLVEVHEDFKHIGYIIDSRYYLTESSWVKTSSGYFLGMLNEIVTLC